MRFGFALPALLSLVATGLPAGANLIISCLEGSVMIGRLERSDEARHTARAHLEAHLEAHVRSTPGLATLPV